MHFPQAMHWRLVGLKPEDRMKLRNVILTRFFIKVPKRTLMLYTVPVASLKVFTNENSAKGGALVLPSLEFRDWKSELTANPNETAGLTGHQSERLKCVSDGSPFFQNLQTDVVATFEGLTRDRTGTMNNLPKLTSKQLKKKDCTELVHCSKDIRPCDEFETC